MKILKKEEIHNGYSEKIQGLWKLIEDSSSIDIMTEEKTEFLNLIKQSSQIHHNENSFLSSYKKIFSAKEKPLFSDKEEMIVQAIYRNSGASEIVGIETQNNNLLFIQVHEAGIYYQILEKSSQNNRELILDAMDMVKKLNEAFLNPAPFCALMLYSKFNQEIPEKDENEEQIIGNSKKNKL
jgi:hypothetical protein